MPGILQASSRASRWLGGSGEGAGRGGGDVIGDGTIRPADGIQLLVMG